MRRSSRCSLPLSGDCIGPVLDEGRAARPSAGPVCLIPSWDTCQQAQAGSKGFKAKHTLGIASGLESIREQGTSLCWPIPKQAPQPSAWGHSIHRTPPTVSLTQRRADPSTCPEPTQRATPITRQPSLAIRPRSSLSNHSKRHAVGTTPSGRIGDGRSLPASRGSDLLLIHKRERSP